jgi:ABC-2 type transport system permease protein
MNSLLIARRDLGAYLYGFVGYVLIAAVLFGEGMLFNWLCLGGTAKYSHDVLEQFFELNGGSTIIIAILLTMRSIAEERQTGTDTLLHTSPISEREIVIGKYVAAMVMVTIFTLLTLYMPALIFVNGKVSYAHIAVGYLGVLALGSAAASIGIFASSLFRSQLAAAVIGGVITLAMIVCWGIADRTDPPFSSLLEYAALWNKHFPPFQKGQIVTSGLVFYGTVTYLFLMLSTRMLEGRRWQ